MTLPNPDVRPTADISRIADYELAAVTVAAVLEKEFGFGRFPVTLRFYPDRRAFAAALVETGYDEAFARETAERMAAIGGYRQVILNEGAMIGQPWPARVASLAHELTHSLQYEWGGGRRGASDQWLREGFAEWIAMQLMHRLRALAFGEVRRGYAAQLRTARPVPLSEMVTFQQWVGVNGRRGVAPYAQAFLAVDHLIARHGLPRVVAYFRRFASSQDRLANFKAAFGEDVAEFEENFTGSRVPGFRVPGSGFRVPGSRVPGSGFRVPGFRVPGSGVPGSGFRGSEVPRFRGSPPRALGAAAGQGGFPGSGAECAKSRGT